MTERTPRTSPAGTPREPAVLRTSRFLSVLAALAPASVLLCATGVGLVALDSPRGRDAPALVGTLTALPALAALATAVALYLAARGPRAPAWLPLMLGALPIVAMSVLTLYLAADLAGDGVDAGYELRRGVSDALGARASVLAIAAPFAGVTALGLGLASLARRAPGRRVGAGLGLGFLAGLPLAALVAQWTYAALDHDGRLRFAVGALIGPVALFALLVPPLALAGVGRDEDGKSVRLAVASTVALLLTSTCGSSLLWMIAASETARHALGGSWEEVARAASGPLELRARVFVAALAALLPVAAVGLWSLRLRRAAPRLPSSGRATVAPALLVLALVALDSASVAGAERLLERTDGDGGADPPLAIEHLELGATGQRAELDLAVGEDATVVTGEAPVPTASLADAAARASVVRALQRRLRTAGPMRAAPPPDRLADEPRLGLALDRRVSGSSLRGLVAVGTRLGAAAFYVFRRTEPDGDVDETVRRALPLVRPLLGQRWEGLLLHLGGAVPEGMLEEQPGWHGVIRAAGVHVAPRQGSPVLPFDVLPDAWTAQGVAPITPPQLLIASRGRPIVRLAVGDDATAATTARAVRWLETLGAAVVLVPELPRDGSRPVTR